MIKEKWVLTRTLHLGYCRETFEKGAVLELHRNDSGNEFLQVGGRQFDKVQDLEILKKQASKYQEDPWVLSYNENFEEEEIVEKTVVVPVENKAEGPIKLQHKKDTFKTMKIIKSDMDLMEGDIDISHTKNSVIQAEKKAAENELKNSRNMEIVVGQENVVNEIPVEPRKEMKIVNGDEEYGMKGNGYASLNPGEVKVKTANEVAQMRKEALDGSGNVSKEENVITNTVEELETTEVKVPVIKKAKKLVKQTKKAKKVKTTSSKSKRGRPKKEKTPESIAEEKAKKAAYQREYRAKQKANKEGK